MKFYTKITSNVIEHKTNVYLYIEMLASRYCEKRRTSIGLSNKYVAMELSLTWNNHYRRNLSMTSLRGKGDEGGEVSQFLVGLGVSMN